MWKRAAAAATAAAVAVGTMVAAGTAQAVNEWGTAGIVDEFPNGFGHGSVSMSGDGTQIGFIRNTNDPSELRTSTRTFGTWSTPSLVPPGNTSLPSNVLVSNSGEVLMAQGRVNGDNQVITSRRSGATWSTLTQLDTDLPDYPTGLTTGDFSLSDDGDVAIYFKENQTTNKRVVFAARFVDGAWQQSPPLSDPALQTKFAAVSGDGKTLIWIRDDPDGTFPFIESLMMSEWVNGAWTSAVEITPPDFIVQDPSGGEPRLSTDGSVAIFIQTSPRTIRRTRRM